jgi:hypothetical protein
VTENNKRWLAWVITVLATLAISLFFGVQYPIPDQPSEPVEPIELGANFSNPIDIEDSSSAAAPALTFQDDTDTGFFRSAADTLNAATGGTEQLELDSTAFTVVPALDVDNNIDQDGTADEVQLSITGYTTQTNDLVQFDGGLTDVGGGSYSTADGDNDLGVAADLEVDGELELDGALDADSTANFADTVTFAAGLMLPALDATEAITLTASDCGKTYFLNAATEFETILPAISTVSAGCSLQFIVKAAPSGAHYTIITGNSKENVLIGGINELEVDTGDDGPTSTADDTITFHDSPAAAVGDYVYMISDGTSWYYRGQAALDGAVVPSQAD